MTTAAAVVLVLSLGLCLASAQNGAYNVGEGAMDGWMDGWTWPLFGSVVTF